MNSIYDYNCVKHMRRRYVMKRRVCKNIIITGVIITMILCGGCGRRREEQPVSVKHEEEDYQRYDFKDIWFTLTVEGKNVGFPFDVKDIPEHLRVHTGMNEEDIKEELKDVGTVFCGVYKDNTPTNIYLTIKPEDGTTDISKGMVVGINIYANEKDMLSGNEEMCDICIYGIKLGTPMSEVIEILNEPSYKYEGEEQISYEYYDNENDGINFISYNGETVSQIDVYFYD